MDYGIYGILIGIIVIALGAMLGSMLARRSFYQKIDDLDMRKQGILSASVPAELQKFKQWPMEGETKEKFERWHQSWDELVSVHTGQIDEALYRSEEDLDKYRFLKVKSDLAATEQLIEELESMVHAMLDEMAEFNDYHASLLDIVKKDEKELYQFRKTLISQNSAFGPTYDLVETEIAVAEAKRTEMMTLKQEGQVSEAFMAGQVLSEKVTKIRELVQVIPQFVRTVQFDLKHQLNQLRAGHKEMQMDGYALETLGLVEEIEQAEDRRLALMTRIEQLDFEHFETDMQQLSSDIDQLFEAFSSEVDARQYVKKEFAGVKERERQTNELMTRLHQEMSRLVSNYEINARVGEEFEQLDRERAVLAANVLDIEQALVAQVIPFSLIKSKVQDAKRSLDQFGAMHERFIENTNSLRKEELEVRNKLESWKKELSAHRRLLAKSAMPVVPTDLTSDMRQLQKGVQSLDEQFEKAPFNMTYIVGLSHDVEETMDNFRDRVKALLRQVTYAEQLLQYANRYRRRDNEVHVALTLAENKFLHGEYGTAVEIGERVLGRFDEGAAREIRQRVEKGLEQQDMLRK
ncbi:MULTISPECIES: septation ring formation regulator EzrA [unclassified Exiguobacterium]|uniref:septation ring formation regulator EzrA n=2 Tax=Exiguobacterium TaxID=33986 RepID=UPI00103B28BC|nr:MULTISPECIES: septation ring formation regulator EzrA [unclassified Exiguobacterium]TCI39482.1 septation ring formation regulator EzrA [Exiguobacterium sp. SH4S7]TCI47823.1 septation ring formation regulator EzrA [Exiguobacterium sp. SH5S32]TCI54707.1 septation ring formation regulator EzrA [Exiguobacterium sp. SH1S4]TCI61558.1 septation ring formation regulator EzrA [Exiguobacterium sp. SH0S2]TCI73238.1 septation ring formation regulator EzrA [Exiguobacterium sp. SH0S7]